MKSTKLFTAIFAFSLLAGAVASHAASVSGTVTDKTTGKPAAVIEKIVDGKMAKFYEEVCLIEQPFIKDQAVSIKELIAQKVAKLGENITVRRFARFKVGAPDWTVAQTKAVEGAAE